ncbi:carbohydrate kinase family protein [Aggregatilinea lenta]|uniref:carbohydrate kinase family protein n=1 Tax=Aggregatilinea lenta TaxID=913108 RepID=UPI000E5B30AD|nr:carbohydrate kinase family protein [Aggregatilinea lenta]
MIDYVAFGIILDDIVFPRGVTQMGVLGGGGPQTAWGMAAALGSGAEVGLVTGVGTDLDVDALAPMQAAGVNLDGVRRTDQPTPRAWQVLEFNGRRTQLWRVPGPSLGVQLARNWDVLPPAYRAARHFHWGIHPDDVARDLAFARHLRSLGKHVSLEPFRSPDAPLSDDDLRALLDACDVFSPNLFEAARITGRPARSGIVRRCREMGGRVLALRCGADGADVWDLPRGEGVRVPAAAPAAVVDEVGAGNAFCGALLARLDDGIAEAACHASAAASYLVEQVGIPAALPDPADYARRVMEVRAGMEFLRLE